MASEAKVEEEEASFATRIPRPVEGGIEYLESLGRFVDDLMGDSGLRARVRTELEPLLLRGDSTFPISSSLVDSRSAEP